MAFVLPSKREAGVLMNPDLSKEWDGTNKVISSDGTEITWAPPPPRPVMPDWSEIKSIRQYFNRSYKNNFWPAWLYNHKTGEQRVVKDAHEAAELGVCYRPRTKDEVERFGEGNVWDFKEDSDWRDKPLKAERSYNPRHPEQGKEYVATPVPQATANRQMLESVLPEVTAAVVAALRQDASVGKDVDPKDREDFLAFLAWKKTQEAIDVVAPEPALKGEPEPIPTDKPDDERTAWLTEAERRGLKVDGRWSTERLKLEVEKHT